MKFVNLHWKPGLSNPVTRGFLGNFGLATVFAGLVMPVTLAQTNTPMPLQPPQSNGAAFPNLPATGGPAPTSSGELVRLNPSPDPLYLPTRPEEVKIDLNQPLSLAQSVEVARRNNPQLQVIEQQLRQSRASLRQSAAALYPNLSFATSVGANDSALLKISNQEIQNQFNNLPPLQQFLQGRPNTINTFSAPASASLQLSYNIFTSGQRDGSIKAAQEQVRNAELDLQRQLEQLRFDVTNNYYDIQQADALVRIAQAAVENSRISLRDAVARERAGLGTVFEVLQSEVQLANNQQQLIQAQSQQSTARRQLAQILNVANTVNLSAADPIQVIGEWQLSLEQSIALGFRNRAELAQQISQRNVALQQRRVALGNLGPQISVSATGNGADDLADGSNPQVGYAVNGQLSLVIFDGGASKASAAQQEASAAIAEAQFANFRNLIRFQIEQSYYTLQSSDQNIRTNRVAVQQATEGLRLARLRFQAGVGTQLEVSNAETSLTQAQSNLLSATVDYNRAISALQRYVSGLPLNPRNITATP